MSIKTVGSKSEKVRKRLFGTLVLGGFAALMLPFTGAATPQYSYVINETVNGETAQLAAAYTKENHPNMILNEQQITLRKGDTYQFTEAGWHRQGSIDITRAFPVYIKADGGTNEVRVCGGTVADALREAWITLGERDVVSLPLENEVEPGTEIVVTRITTKRVIKEEPIPFETKTTYTKSLVPNARVKVKAGKKGIETRTYEETYIDGELVGSDLIASEITKAPVAAEYQVGSTKQVVSQFDPPKGMKFDKNGNPVNYKKKVTGKATAYSTRRKTKLVEGCVAMDLSKYPRGSWLYIKSRDGSYVYGYAKVADTGTALVQGKVLVDCFFDTFAECYQFGAKTLDVYVLS